MNRQVVACVLTLLTASTVSASDSVNWMSKFSGQLEKLQTVRTGCAKSYDFIRSRCVNSSLLGKCPQALQKIVKDNFGMMTIVTGATVSSLGLWYVSNRRYASNFRNGTEEHRTRVMKDSVEVLADRLPEISADGSFAIKPSFLRPKVLDVTVEQKEQRTHLSITNRLQPSLPVCSFELCKTQALNLRTNLGLVREMALALACASDATGPITFVPDSSRDDWLHMAPKDIRQALQEVGPLTALLEVSADQLKSSDSRIELLSHPLLGLKLIGNQKEVEICLAEKVSGQQIYFALQSAKGTTALKRLQDNWTARGMPKGIRDIMIEYAAYAPPFREEKMLDVKFSAAEIISVSNQACLVGNSAPYETMPLEWVLMVNDATNKGALVWPIATNEELNEHALADLLGRFFSSVPINKKFLGIKKYVAVLHSNPGQPAQPVICKIVRQANNADKSDAAVADRVITLCANGKEIVYTLGASESFSAEQQLADDTLRRQVIAMITKNYQGCTATEYTLYLRQDGTGAFRYIMQDTDSESLWLGDFFTIASSSNDAGQSLSHQGSASSDTAPGLGHYWDSAAQFDADQAAQAAQPSTSIDAEQPSLPDRKSAVAAILLTASNPDDVPSAAPASPDQLADDPASSVEEALQPLADSPERMSDSNSLSAVDPLYEEQVVAPASSNQPVGFEQSANPVISEEQGLPVAGPASSGPLVVQSGDWGVACFASFSDGEELGSFDTSEDGEEDSEEGEEESDDEDPADAPLGSEQPVAEPAGDMFDLLDIPCE